MNNPPTWILNTTCDLILNNSNPLLGYAAAFEFNQNQADAASLGSLRWTVRDIKNDCNSFSESQMLKSLQQPDNQDRCVWTGSPAVS